MAPPAVFLSYAHEPPSHREAVRRLHNLLLGSGVGAVLDRFHEAPGQDWKTWTRMQIKNCDFVLVFVSREYQLRADSSRELPGDSGRGVRWEADYIGGLLYDDVAQYRRILPVLLPGESMEDRPFFFAPGRHYYRVRELSPRGVESLLAVLLGRAAERPNVRHQPGWVFLGPEGAEGAQEHIELRGRGQRSVAQGGDLFYGRAAAVGAVIRWLESPVASEQVLVVTGQPGAGKSAVVARAALHIASGTDQPLGLVFHARAATWIDFAAAIGMVTATPVADSVSEMVKALRGALPAGGWWRLVVDALDQTLTRFDRDRVAEALREIAALGWRVVVATRPWSADRSKRLTPGALLSKLGVRHATGPNLVDLDDDAYFDRDGLVAFCAALLRQDGATTPSPADGAWSTYRANTELCERLATAIATRAGRNHLVAALTADPLSQLDRVVDPTAVLLGRSRLPLSVGEALTNYLEQQPTADQARIRGLLTALAYGRGGGVDDRRWLAFAGAIGHAATVVDLDTLRDSPAADYLLHDSTVDGVRTARLFHQALADELLASRPRREDEAKILSCLLPTPPSAWSSADGYARNHAAEHAAAAGRIVDLLDDPVFPTVADVPRLLAVLPADLAHAPAAAAAVLRTVSHRANDLPAARRTALLSLAAAHLGLTVLSRRYHHSGRIAIEWAHSRGTVHQTLRGHSGRVSAVALGRAGERDVIASGSADTTIRIWDAITGSLLGLPLLGHTDRVNAVALGRVGERDVIVSGSADATVRVWDAITGDPVGQPLTGHEGAVWAVALGRLGDRDIIASASGSTVKVWDAEARSPRGPALVGHMYWVRAVALGQIGAADVVVSGSADETIRIWDGATGNARGQPLTGHTGWVRAAALGRVGDTEVIVSGSADATVRIWDITDAPGRQPLTGHTSEVNAVSLGRIGELAVVVSGSADATLRIWDAATGGPLGEPLVGHTGGVNAVALGRVSDRDLIISGSSDATVRIWDATAGYVGQPLAGHSHWVRSVALGRVGHRDVITSGSDDRTVRIWDAATGAPLAEPLIGHSDWVSAVAVGRVNGRDVVISGSADTTVRMWDATRGAPLGRPLTGHKGYVNDVALGLIGGRAVIVSGSADGTMRIWDPTTGEPLGKALTGHTDEVNAVTLGRIRDHDVIISGSADATVRIWDPTTGEPLGKPLTGHTDWIRAVVLGRWGGHHVIVSAGDDATVLIRDASTGTALGDPLTGHTGWVRAVALGRLGGRDVIISAGDDVTVRIWDASTRIPVAVQDTVDSVDALAFKGQRLVFSSGRAVCVAKLA